DIRPVMEITVRADYPRCIRRSMTAAAVGYHWGQTGEHHAETHATSDASLQVHEAHEGPDRTEAARHRRGSDQRFPVFECAERQDGEDRHEGWPGARVPLRAGPAAHAEREWRQAGIRRLRRDDAEPAGVLLAHDSRRAEGLQRRHRP